MPPRVCQGLCRDLQVVPQIPRPLGCSPLPSQLPSPESSPTGGGVHGVLHHWDRGLRTPAPPLSTPGLAGAAGREGTVPTAPLQKGKWLILLPGHSGASASTWGRASSLPGSSVLLPEDRGQPREPAPTGCGHLQPPWNLSPGVTSALHPKGPQKLSSHCGTRMTRASVTVTLQPAPASASSQWSPKARAAPVLIIAESSQAKAGAKKAVPFPGLFSFHQPCPPSTETLRANIRQGKVRWQPMGWGPRWAPEHRARPVGC